MSNGSPRLDSWKAIAAYLGRDERTVQRWERRLGLPVRRVPGGRGTSVFAYADDLDAWLAANEPSIAPRAPEEARSAATPAPPTRFPLRWGPAVAAAALCAAAIVAVFVWRPAAVSAADLRVELTPDGLIAYARGREVWRHSVPGERMAPMDGRQGASAEVLQRTPAAVVAATSIRVNTATERVHSGQLWSFSPSGTLTRVLGFDDTLTFGHGSYAAPWGITDFRVDERDGPRRIAVSLHHHEWWPGVVTVLDEQWRRTSTFVHAGWIERVAWLGHDRLLAAGFSEVRDGGMLALLDPAVGRAQTPIEADSPFHCGACGEGRPVRYVVIPRSELNRVTGSRFNRARLELNGDRIVARTLEVADGDHEIVDALYEFTPSLDLVRASWSSRYWEMHARLEAAGLLDHPRERCPDRDGPSGILTWTPAEGWQTTPRP